MPTLNDQINYLQKYRKHELILDQRTILLFAVATVVIPMIALLICLLIEGVWSHSVRITTPRIFGGIVPALPFSGALSYSFNRLWMSLTSRFYLIEGKLNISADRSKQPAKYWLCVLVHGLVLLHFAFLVIFPSIAVVFPASVGVTPFE